MLADRNTESHFAPFRRADGAFKPVAYRQVGDLPNTRLFCSSGAFVAASSGILSIATIISS